MSRLTAEQHSQLHEQIRVLLRSYRQPSEMMRLLDMPRSTLFRHLKELREEDAKWVAEMAEGAFMSAWRNALEVMLAQVKELEKIRAEATRPSDKIAATLAIVEVTAGVINLLAQGPTVWALQHKTGWEPKPLK
jgi:hypothetical protein